jgi:hypothetical protein
MIRQELLAIACAVLAVTAFVLLSGTYSVNNVIGPAAVPVASESASTTAPEPAASSSDAIAAPDASEPVAPALDTAAIASARLTAAGGQLLKSIVNIICLPKSGTGLRGISGSGVIIDSRGLILTAAHVAQYFLLRDYPRPGSVTCTIRTGSPAADAYTAEVVYISPSWIEDNSDVVIDPAPRGTGEDDFAVLAITGSATKDPLPSSFSYVPLGSGDPSAGENTAIAGYAAQFLASSQIEDELYPTVVFHDLTQLFTFDTGSIDSFSIAGTPIAQEGSSGGGVADASGHLIGLIDTSSTKGDASERTLHAITPLHIRASFARDMGTNFDTYLSSNSVSALISNFSSESIKLERILERVLKSQ